MNSLFGLELSTPVNFVIAFVVVLVLIAAATWLVRRFGMTRLDATARGRQPRLAVIDSANVDGRRKLVIIRRDNVEHLLMIGGPTDVVVETAIVRASAAPAREAPQVRASALDTLPRAIPLPDPTPWPLQPEPAPAPAPAAPPAAPRIERPRIVADEPAHWPPAAEPAAPPAPPPRPARNADTLAGLAAELSQPQQPARSAQGEPARAAGPQPAEAVAPSEPAPVPTPALSSAPAPDQNLADMAQRLEAALRKPMAPAATPQPAKAAAAPAAAPRLQVSAEPKRAEAKAAPRPEPKPAAAVQSKGNAQPKPLYESLEQEMASLLGRPGKT